MLDALHPLVLGEGDVHHLGTFLTLDPLDTLELWVNQEWVARARAHDGGVLKRNSIGWETLGLPHGLGGLGRQHEEWVSALSVGETLGNDVTNPLVGPEVLSEIRIEWSDVGDEGSRDEGVTNHGELLLLEVDDVLGPSDLLVAETVDETVSEGQVQLKTVGVVLDGLLLGNSLFEQLLKSIDLLDNNADLLLDDGELSQLLVGELLGSVGGLHEWLNLLEDGVVLDDVDDPVAQVSGGRRLL
jgi:hypothetical protein